MISWILIVGVLASVAFESVGLALNYLQTADLSVSFAPQWRVGSNAFFSFASTSLTSAIAAPSAFNIVALGVVLLMLTPYVRVLVSVLYFAVIRDVKYFGVTLIVLAIITLSLLTL